MDTRNVLKIGSRERIRLGGFFARWRHTGATLAASASLSLGIAGCGAMPDGGNAAGDSQVGSTTSALRCTGDPTNGDCPWKGTWARLLPHNNVDVTHNWAPTLIAGNPGWITFTVDSTNHYRMLQWHANGRGPQWDYFGPSTLTWNSRLAASLANDTLAQPTFVVAGKARSTDANNNRILTSTGTMGVSGLNPGNPIQTTAFTLLDTNASHTYVTGGLPALASRRDGSGGGSMVVTYFDDNGSTIYAHHRLLPYVSNTWTTRITGPALPPGWKVVYAPTIAYSAPVFHIVVHARNASTNQDALYETYFNYSGGSAFFSDETGAAVQGWKNQVIVPPSVGINDDPWITVSSALGITAYFRSGTQIKETAYQGPINYLPVNPTAGISFASAPAGTGDYAFDMGTQVIVARTLSNQIYFHDTNQDSSLEP
jgi:hypothetical protein